MQIAPVGSATSGQSQGPRQLLARLALGPERWHHQPPPPGTPQLGKDTGPQQRRLARPGSPEQNQQAGPTQGAAGSEPLDQMPDVVIPAEVDGSVFLLEGEQARIGRSGAIPGEPALGRERDGLQLLPELFQTSCTLLAQIEHLQVGSDARAGIAIGCLDHLEDRLAEEAGTGEFSIAPLGSAPVGALEDQQRLRKLDLAVEGLLPIRPRRDTGMLVEVKKGRVETLLLQPGLDPAG